MFRRRQFGYSGSNWLRKRNYSLYGGASKKRSRYTQKVVANQQRDQANYTINIPTKLTAFNRVLSIPTDALNPSNNPKIKQIGTYALNIYECLRQSTFFQNYSQMFDEFKINNVTVKLTPAAFTIPTNTKYTSLTVFTAWDRTGLEWDQVYINALASSYQADGKLGVTSTGTWESPTTADIEAGKTDGLYVTLGDDVGTYSSAQTRSVNPNTNTQIVRKIYPTALLEKSQYLSTDSLRQWYDYFDVMNGRFYGIPFGSSDTLMAINRDKSEGGSVTPAILKLSPAISGNPCFLVEDNAIAFKPTLLVGIFGSGEWADMMNLSTDYTNSLANTTNNPVLFNVEVDVDVQFRGIRKASSMYVLYIIFYFIFKYIYNCNKT